MYSAVDIVVRSLPMTASDLPTLANFAATLSTASPMVIFTSRSLSRSVTIERTRPWTRTPSPPNFLSTTCTASPSDTPVTSTPSMPACNTSISYVTFGVQYCSSTSCAQALRSVGVSQSGFSTISVGYW